MKRKKKEKDLQRKQERFTKELRSRVHKKERGRKR
jgi:hypothetical protein